MANKHLAVIGCFRSGTNYTKALLELNYECRVTNNVFGWKHGLVPIVSNEAKSNFNNTCDGVFFVTKNPFSFLFSLFNYHKNAGLNIIAEKEFIDFIREDIVIFDQAQPHSPRLKFRNPIELWNFMNWHYVSVHNIKHVRYEMLVANPETITEKLARKLGLIKKRGDFIDLEKKVKRMNDSQIFTSPDEFQSNETFSKNLYLDADYMKTFTQQDVSYVMKQLDYGLAESLGYADIISDLTERS